jgi:hypothetical protein
MVEKIYPHPGITEMEGQLHCADHTELIAGLATLAIKATYITAALTVNAALLLCIFSALLMNAVTSGTITTQITALQGDVNDLQSLTKDHAALVSTQREVLRRLDSLERHEPK